MSGVGFVLPFDVCLHIIILSDVIYNVICFKEYKNPEHAPDCGVTRNTCPVWDFVGCHFMFVYTGLYHLMLHIVFHML